MESFMKPHARYGDWYVIETPDGTTLLPTDILNGELPMDPDNPEYVHDDHVWELLDYAPGGVIENVTTTKGWGARLSAPGYLDCTDWMGPYDTEAKALAELAELYDDA